ncbi:MAG: FHA domain-containing protein, partial [Polyangiaceae bacterium]
MVGDDDSELEATIQSNEPGSRAHPAAALDVSVIVLSGAERGGSAPLRGKVRVGKAPENDLVLSEESVSRHHCEISRVPGGVRIRDLGSTNGTFVEHARITDATTPVGSVVRVGNSVELALRPDLALLAIEPFAEGELEGVIGGSLAMRRIFRVL